MKFPKWLKIYGDVGYRGDCPLEAEEQRTFFNYLRRIHPEIGKIALHPRNEGKRYKHQATLQIAEGMATGAADVIIPNGFVCELKRLDHTKSRLGTKQIEYLMIAKKYGCFVCVALGHKAAINALEDFLTENKYGN